MAARGTPQPVTWDQVAAFRLSRHHLAERAPARALIPVAGAMGGAQAQVLSAAQMSLWARVRGLRVHDVQTAIRDRALVRTWCMRRTLHLVPSEDLAVFVRGSAGRAESAVRSMLARGAAERVIERLVRAALGALDRPLTGRELLERVGRSLRVPVRTVRWDGWGHDAEIPGIALGRLVLPARHLLHVVAARGVVCSGPNRGTEPTFVRADAWIPRWHDTPRPAAEAELLRRYLRAFGPATPADFAAWTGMAQRAAREIWARQEADLAPVSVDGWTAAVLRDDLRALARARREPLPVRLLPYFDSYLLGHKTREHLIVARHRKRVYRTQGWIAPVVLVDGRIAGIWALTHDRAVLRVRVTRLTAVSPRTAAGIREEAERLGRFLGSRDVELQFVSHQ
jgi:hypothetical protein